LKRENNKEENQNVELLKNYLKNLKENNQINFNEINKRLNAKSEQNDFESNDEEDNESENSLDFPK
jgi:hypothetical protein